MKNAFYFILKPLFEFLSCLFGHVGKWLENKANDNFKIYDATNWKANNYNIHIAQHLKK